MCLGIPGKVVHWIDSDPTFARAELEFDGIRRECYMACVLEAQVGDYVIVHAGVAICRVDAAEAKRVLEELQHLDMQDDSASSQEERSAKEESP